MKRILILALLALTACVEHSHVGPFEVGPFIASNAPLCTSDAQCNKDHYCGFPAANTHAVCMPGQNPIDSFPDGNE